MGLASKKKELIKQILEKSYTSPANDQLEGELLNLLSADAPSLKLYKYRAFSSYSLDNLRNQTIFCAQRSAFNDPFDCRVGIDFSSFMADFIDLDTNRIAKIFGEFLKKCNNRPVSLTLSDELAIIDRWSNEKSLVDFCTKITKIDITPKRVRKMLLSNPNILFEIVRGAIENEGYRKAFDDKQKFFETRVSEVLSSTGISKKQTGIESMATLKGIDTDADEIDIVQRLCIAEGQYCNFDIVGWFNTFDAQFSDFIDQLVYVGSLTTSCRSNLMWAHYADSHRGFCIEYDYQTYSKGHVLPFPVVYSKEMVKMPWKYCINKEVFNSERFSAQIIRAILTKDECWRYENEWRIIIPNNMPQTLQMPRISCVYLGALCSPEDENTVVCIAKEKGFSVKRMVIDKGKFILHPRLVYDSTTVLS